MKFELIATSTFELEAVVKRQIQRLGYEIKEVSDGKITYIGDERGIVRNNLWAEQVYTFGKRDIFKEVRLL